MPKVRVRFELDYYSGSGSEWRRGPFVVVRSIDMKDAERLGLDHGNSWRHWWSDGASAVVSARLMAKGERRGHSNGFMGYEWMIDRILRWGRTKCICEIDRAAAQLRRITKFGNEYDECADCHSTRYVPA